MGNLERIGAALCLVVLFFFGMYVGVNVAIDNVKEACLKQGSTIMRGDVYDCKIRTSP